MDAQREYGRKPSDAKNQEESEAARARAAHESDGTETEEGDKARADQPIDPND